MMRGQGAALNGVAIGCRAEGRMDRGAIGTGFSNRTDPDAFLRAIGGIPGQGGRFFFVMLPVRCLWPMSRRVGW